MSTDTPLLGAQSAEAQQASAHDQGDGLDRIELRGLAAHGYHGVHEHERRDGQRFVVDIVVHTDTRSAAAGDDLTRTLDYTSLASQVVAVLTGPPVSLLETLAERIAATVLAHPQAVTVDVAVHKPQAPLFDQHAVAAAEFADVVVAIRRDRTRVPVVDPAGSADLAPRAGWASAAPAPALAARAPDAPVEPVTPVDDLVVPDLAPSAADLAVEPSVAPYEAADLVETPDASVPAQGLEAAAPTDQADEAAPAPAPYQSMWDEPLPPSIPPATVTPAPSSAGAVVVTPGFGPVVAQLAANPDAAPAAQTGDEPVVDAPAGPGHDPVAGPEAGDPAGTPVPASGPGPVGGLDVPPQDVGVSWPVPGPDAPAGEAVPEPVWVPAPGPQETPPQAQSDPAAPAWPGDPVPAPPVPEPAPWPSPAPPVDTPGLFGAAEARPAAEPFGAGSAPAEPVVAAWLQASVPPALPETPAPAETAPPAPSWAAPAVPAGDPAPLAGEPWGSAPAPPGGWAPPPPPQWANLDAPAETPGDAAAPPAPFVPDFGTAFADPASTPGTTAADVLDRSPSVLTDVVIGVGGNLGPVQETLRWAVLRLGAMTGLEVVAVGPLARTAAVGSTDQPDYLNTVVLARTLLSPRDLLRRLQGVEREAGRERLERWGPRTLDLDIIVYGDLVAGDDDLTLPHPNAHCRAFVLGPWASLAPDAVLPGPNGGPVSRLADQAPDAPGVRWMALDWLTDTPGEPGAA